MIMLQRDLMGELVAAGSFGRLKGGDGRGATFARAGLAGSTRGRGRLGATAAAATGERGPRDGGSLGAAATGARTTRLGTLGTTSPFANARHRGENGSRTRRGGRSRVGGRSLQFTEKLLLGDVAGDRRIDANGEKKEVENISREEHGCWLDKVEE